MREKEGLPNFRGNKIELSAALDAVKYGRHDGAPPTEELLMVLDATKPTGLQKSTRFLTKPAALLEDLHGAVFNKEHDSLNALRAYSFRQYRYGNEDPAGWRVIAYLDVLKQVGIEFFLDVEEEYIIRDQLIDRFLGVALSHQNMFMLPPDVQKYAIGLESFRQERLKVKKGQPHHSRRKAAWQSMFSEESGAAILEGIKESIELSDRSNIDFANLIENPGIIEPYLMDLIRNEGPIDSLGSCWAAASRLANFGKNVKIRNLVENYRSRVAGLLEDAFLQRTNILAIKQCPVWVVELAANEAMRMKYGSVLTQDGRSVREDQALVDYQVSMAMNKVLVSGELRSDTPEFKKSVAAFAYIADNGLPLGASQARALTIERLNTVKKLKRPGAELRLSKLTEGIYTSLKNGTLI